MTLTKDWLQKFGWPETLAACQPLAIAHRGARAHAPENTQAAFEVAADLASEMWELDVHLSTDGVCVVTHDDDLGSGVRVSGATWAEISAVRLPDEQHVPRLEEIVALARETGCGLYIEIKAEGAGAEAWRILRETGFRFACLASFNTGWITELRAAGCDYPLAVLVPVGEDPVTCIGDLQVEIVHLCWRNASDAPHEFLSDTLLGQLRTRGHQIVIWHEDRAEVLAALSGKPIMAICSDRPEMLKPYRPDPNHRADIVCHRAANAFAPENTLEGARICIDQQFQYIEIDVRTSADGELVVLHDAMLDRTTDGSGPVKEKTLAEIRALDAGGWFSDVAAGYRVPTLGQVLEQARGRIGVYVEIKQAAPEQVLDVVTAHDMLPHCFFWSRDTDALRWMRKRSPDIMLMAPRWMYASVAEAYADYQAQIIEFDVEKDDLSEVSQCRAVSVRSMIFSTRHNWDDLASCLKYQPDMLNLDRPDRLKILASYPMVRAHFLSMLKGRHGEK